MAKFLVRGNGKFLEGKLTETKGTDGYPYAKIEPTDTGVEASTLAHFGTEHIKLNFYNAWDRRYAYEAILTKAVKAGADYVFMPDPKNAFSSYHAYETTLTMYLKRR